MNNTEQNLHKHDSTMNNTEQNLHWLGHKLLRHGHRIPHFIRIFSYLTFDAVEQQELRLQSKCFYAALPSANPHIEVPSAQYSTINAALHAIENQKARPRIKIEIWLKPRIYKKPNDFLINTNCVDFIGSGIHKTVIQNKIIINNRENQFCKTDDVQYPILFQNLTISPGLAGKTGPAIFLQENIGLTSSPNIGLTTFSNSYVNIKTMLMLTNVEVTNCCSSLQTPKLNGAIQIEGKNTFLYMNECNIHHNKGRGIVSRRESDIYLNDCIVCNNDWSGIVSEQNGRINIHGDNTLITKNGNGMTPNQYGIRVDKESNCHIDIKISEAHTICHNNYDGTNYGIEPSLHRFSNYGGGGYITFDTEILKTPKYTVCNASPHYEGTHGLFGNCRSCGWK